MREDRNSRISSSNQTLLFLTPIFLISLIIAASLWAANLQSTSKLNKQFKGGESKEKGSDGRQVEIVVPHKSWPPPLKEHDLLYDSSSPEALQRHHSGHYRRKLADIWDPHPQYEFKAFGKKFHLQLQLSSGFASPNLQVTQVWNNMTIKENPGLKTNGCFYSGTVLGDPMSSVAVNLCHGITGHIRTSDGSYLIEPAEPYKDHDTPIKHSVFKLPSTRPSSKSSTTSEPCHLKERTERRKVAEEEHAPRRKRSLSQEYFIELMVVADKKMAEYHGKDLKEYILTLMSIVTQIYKDASIGNPMSVAVVKLYVLNNDDLVPRNSREKGTSASAMLRKFCDWQHSTNDDNDDNPNHHDSALLLTRENICRDPYLDKCDTLGLAELGTMCDKSSSCALVRDNGLSAAFTIAHELGHVLNMPHDDDLKCNSLGNSVDVNNVMSRMLDHNTYPWAWSNCSRHFLTEYLDAGYGSCLLDQPSWDYLLERKDVGQLPGEDFTENRQCELVYGKNSKICPYMPVCKRLWCALVVGDKEYCLTQHMPWADGTSCDKGQWCQRGSCVPRDRSALKPVDGGWGPWQGFSQCSRTCGGGVKQAERICNNPRPANGGRYCVGRRIKYRSCATAECPSPTKDFRAEQCAKYDNNNLKIQGLSNDVKWVPKYGGIVREDRCKLYCRVAGSSAYYLISEKVIDGTVCGPDTYDICVNGVCNPAGCDHLLNSTVKLDYCGQCGGNNSTCQQFSGSYDTSKYGYNAVVRIPAGSSNLEVIQIGHMGTNKDDNYLALVDSETNDYILNGNHVVSMFRKLILYGGSTLEYTGSDAVDERINSSRPLTKDLIVMVLSVGNLYPPNIIFKYTIQKSTLALFSWQISNEWSLCDKVCNGESHKDVICVHENGGEVASEMCKELEKPKSPSKPCNQHCTLKWQATSQSECSSHCGPGTRSLSFQCIYAVITPSIRGDPIHNSSCAHLPRPPTTEPCTGPCDEARWNFTQWEPCSKTCGEGVQRRKAMCVDELNRPRNESDCRESEKKVERICNLQKCPQWGFGEWTPCSATCGEGHRRRSYWCHIDNLKVSTRFCTNLSVPHHLTVESCQLDPCPHWISREWSSCSVSCGEGEEVRMVECSVPNKCSYTDKPVTVRSCNMKPCSLGHENAMPDFDNSAFRDFTWRPKPWGPCSVTCGEGKKWREMECYDEKVGKITDHRECLSHAIPVKRIESCTQPRCPSWELGYWGPCSANCDQGTETREVHCVSHSGSHVDERYCPHPRPGTERICYSPVRCPTPTWKASPWSQCSVSCGGGYRSRTVICDSETRHCPQPIPASTETCNSDPCTKGSWKLGEWSQCSATCGPGSRFRQVRCKSSSGEDLPDDICGTKSSKPRHIMPCHNNPSCSKPVLYDWQHSRHWSPCSKTCGKGTRQRKVWCAKSSGVRVPDSECSASRKPKGIKECQRVECPFDWAPKPWSQCSVTCGKGFKSRLVQCYGYKGFGHGYPGTVSDSFCKNSTKPPIKTDCHMPPCPKHSGKNYRWVPGSWEQCSERCSRRGQQKRKLFCYLGNAKVKRPNCLKNQRPKRRQKCQTDRCETCLELQRSSNTRKDGEYKLHVSGTQVSVHCHGMNSSRPREYITLHTPRENYAEVYDMSLDNPDTCPYNGQRLDFCQCKRNDRPNVGFTFFKKIRINITSLIVDGRDWTYAAVIRGGKVAYGEAGDCYSRAACPQGQFRINLEKTGLKVNKYQQWSRDGEYSHKNIKKYEDDVKVVGVCGGYCGMCRPHRGLKLDVLPP